MSLSFSPIISKLKKNFNFYELSIIFTLLSVSKFINNFRLDHKELFDGGLSI